jgi:hypothetical protein
VDDKLVPKKSGEKIEKNRRLFNRGGGASGAFHAWMHPAIRDSFFSKRANSHTDPNRDQNADRNRYVYADFRRGIIYNTNPHQNLDSKSDGYADPDADRNRYGDVHRNLDDYSHANASNQSSRGGSRFRGELCDFGLYGNF